MCLEIVGMYTFVDVSVLVVFVAGKVLYFGVVCFTVGFWEGLVSSLVFL